MSKPIHTATRYRSRQAAASSDAAVPPLGRRIALQLKSRLERGLGIRILRPARGKRIDQVSRPESPEVIALQNRLPTETLRGFLETLGLPWSEEEIAADVRAYREIFDALPISNLQGGMGFNNGLVVFCFTRAANPDDVVESGVWRGFTTLLLDKATADAAQLFCFDINLENAEWRSPKAQYFEADIGAADFELGGTRRLALFDDHVSQYDRLSYAAVRGIDFMIFDDDLPVTAIHFDGWPSVPTIHMLMHYDEIPHTFEWRSGGVGAMADISGLDCAELARTYAYAAAPDLFDITGYVNSSRTSFLVRRAATA